MSATVYWQPINPEREYFTICGNERECLFKLFHTEQENVLILNKHDISKLKGLAVVYDKINEVIDAINEHEQIRIWCEW